MRGISLDIGNTEKALKVGFRALEITEARLGPEDTNVSSILIRLGRVFIREGKYKEAKAYFKRSLAIIQHKLGPEHPHAADTVCSFINISMLRLIFINFDSFRFTSLGRYTSLNQKKSER